MKWFQNSLRILMAAGSIAGFFGGWAILAHAGKPVDAVPQVDAAPPAELAPLDLPSLAPQGPVPSQLQPLPSLPPSQAPSNFGARPRLRTRGS